MFRKNFHLLYPAGYTGSYINWILHRSETEQSSITVDDPLTESGTSHQHLRVPTHQGILNHMCYIIKCQPSHRVYPSNVRDPAPMHHGTPVFAASWIARFDPDPVIINIYDGHDDVCKFGNINAWTKWPVQWTSEDVWYPDRYNPWCEPDPLLSRNWLVEHWREWCRRNPVMNPDALDWVLARYREWIETKRPWCPEEMSEDYFVVPKTVPKHLYQICLRDIYQNDFIDRFAAMIDSTDSGDFDWSYCRYFHTRWLASQHNLAWFDELHAFRNNQIVGKFLLSNPMTQAFLLDEIRDRLPDTWPTQATSDVLLALGYQVDV